MEKTNALFTRWLRTGGESGAPHAMLASFAGLLPPMSSMHQPVRLLKNGFSAPKLLTRPSTVLPVLLMAKPARRRFVLVFCGFRRAATSLYPVINPALFVAGLITDMASRIAKGVTFAHMQNHELGKFLILVEPSLAQNRLLRMRFSTAC